MKGDAGDEGDGMKGRVATVFNHEASGFESRSDCSAYGDKRTDLGGDERKREGGAEAGLDSESRAANYLSKLLSSDRMRA